MNKLDIFFNILHTRALFFSQYVLNHLADNEKRWTTKYSHKNQNQHLPSLSYPGTFASILAVAPSSCTYT